MPLNVKYNAAINDPETEKLFNAAVAAQSAYWDALRDLETHLETEIEGEDFQHFDEGDLLTFLTDLEERAADSE
jgi:hypothetical protein